MPRLSIIIPCYNSRETIQKCLESIRSSIYKDYELIVVDDHSIDDTIKMAGDLTDKLIRLGENKGSGHARKAGVDQAKGQILCFVDSDIVVKADTFAKIIAFFDRDPKVDAVTGCLAKQHPNRNFLSQYKNLYMHYIFNLLPERVTFLFGSLCAVRREAASSHSHDMRYTPDTEFGQQLFLNGKTIAFIRDLEVVHLKKYTPASFILNDFRVPCSWARLFLRFGGWKQLGKNQTGFAHAPGNQLISVVLAPMIFILIITGFFMTEVRILLYSSLIVWLGLNLRFFIFLFKEKGILFSLKSVGVTLADQWVMALGIFYGFCSVQSTR